MSEQHDTALVQKALEQLNEPTEQAWQRRCCLPSSRFWNVALGRGVWSASEKQHLAGCAGCQRHEARINRLARARPDQPLVAEQRLPSAALTGDRAAEQRLRFAAEPELDVRSSREKDGSAWLRVQHAFWPPGTLVQVTFSGAAASPHRCYGMVHPQQEEALARMRVPEPVVRGKGDWAVAVQVVTPTTMPAEPVSALRTALAQAQKDDPDALRPVPGTQLSGWQMWAKRILEEGKLSPELRGLLDQLAAKSELIAPPPRTARGDKL
jgi:hypothetical protein